MKVLPHPTLQRNLLEDSRGVVAAWACENRCRSHPEKMLVAREAQLRDALEVYNTSTRWQTVSRKVFVHSPLEALPASFHIWPSHSTSLTRRCPMRGPAAYGLDVER